VFVCVTVTSNHKKITFTYYQNKTGTPELTHGKMHASLHEVKLQKELFIN